MAADSRRKRRAVTRANRFVVIDMDGQGWQDTRETIGDVVCRRAKTRGDAPAFVSEDAAPLTYRALARLIDEMGEAVNASGFGRGDRLAIVHPPGAALATVMLGVMNAATALPLKSDLAASELRTQLEARRADGVIVARDADTPAREIAAGLGLPVIEAERGDDRTTGSVRLLPRDDRARRTTGPAVPEDIAYVLATSGTTARGKIVPFRHRHYMARAAVQAKLFGLDANDRSLNLQQLHFNGGLTNIACTIYAGGSVALLPRFSAEDFYRLLDSVKPTWFAGSFTFQQHIYEQADAHIDVIRRSRLRFIRTMSGHLDPDIGAGLERTFGVPLIESYGSTEAGRITGNPQPPGRRKLGTVGPVVGCEAFVADEHGNPLPPGERGEILVRGDQVIDGYEDDPAANAAAFRDGWYRTRDQGYFDADGYLILTGRIEEMINRGGEKVSPQEVDAALAAHPAVAEAAAFAIPHPRLGAVVGAAVVPVAGKGCDKRALRRYLAERLASSKVPVTYFFVERIPKGPTGKVLRNKLTEMFAKAR